MYRACEIADCEQLHFGRGYCNKHYKRWRKTGDPLTTTRAEVHQRVNWMTPEDVAWVAGLFEGEGCVFLQFGRYPQLIVQMTDRDVIERLARIVGNGNITTPTPRPGTKQLYRWTKQGREFVETFYNYVGPWLGERRNQQFLKALCAR